jgi:hypothetical protein
VRVALVGLVAVVALVGCSGGEKRAAAPHALVPLHDVESVANIRRVFNADAGRRRLFLLFSPT